MIGNSRSAENPWTYFALILASPISPEAPGQDLKLMLFDIESGQRQRRSLGRQYLWLASRSNLQRRKYRAENPWEGVANLTLSPSGDHLAFFRFPEGELSGQVEVWEIDEWVPRLKTDFQFGLGSLFFSDDDKHLAIITTAADGPHGTDSNILRVIDILRNTLLLEVESVGVPNHSYAAAFSPDGGQLATGTRCHGVQLWDLEEADRIAHASFGGCWASDRITGLAYSADGQSLYMISEGGSLRSVPMTRIVEQRGQR